MIHARLDNSIRFDTDELGEDLIAELKGAFSHANPEYAKKKRFGFSTHDTPREIETFEFGVEGELKIPRGGIGHVREIFKRYDVKMLTEDARVLGPPLDEAIPPTTLTLRDYQLEVIDAAKSRQNCLIRSPTGSGKTTAMIALASELQLPTIVIVWSANLFDQWRKRIKDELGGFEPGQIKGKKRDIRPITVAMQQTLNRLDPAELADIHDRFGVVICDEVQRFAAKTFVETIATFPAKYRVGVSDDETRKDQKDFLIYDIFGEVAATVDEKKLIKSGAILDVECVVVPTEFECRSYAHAAAASGLRAAGVKGYELEVRLGRKFPDITPEEKSAARYSSNPDFHELLEKMLHDDERNQIAIDIAVEEVSKGEKVLLFAQRRDHVLKLDAALSKRGVKSGVLIGGPDYAEQFEKTVEGINSGRYQAAVGTIQAVGQALDLPTISRGVATCHVATNRQLWRQMRGRLCRTGSKDARLFYLWDRHVFGSVLPNLAKWNNQAKIIDGGRHVPLKQFLKGK